MCNESWRLFKLNDPWTLVSYVCPFLFSGRKENISQMTLAMKTKKSMGRNETATDKYAICLFGSVLRTWVDLTTHEGHYGVLRSLFLWALSQHTLALNLERWLKSIGVLRSNLWPKPTRFYPEVNHARFFHLTWWPSYWRSYNLLFIHKSASDSWASLRQSHLTLCWVVAPKNEPQIKLYLPVPKLQPKEGSWLLNSCSDEVGRLVPLFTLVTGMAWFRKWIKRCLN